MKERILTLTILATAIALSRGAPPDILLIMPDQMRGDCLSTVGHPAVRTPNLDRLAREGVLFRRAYSTVPSCIPARYALLTGQSAQASGVVGFSSRRIATPTLPAALAGAGYTTVLIGRNMHQNPPNPTLGYQREVLGSTYVNDDAYDRYLKEAAPDSGGIRKVIEQTGVTLNLWQANPWPLDDALHPTSWAIRQARQAVAEAPPGSPLFLTASFYSPHPPLFAPRRYFDAILKRKLPAPAHGDWVDWARLTPEGDPPGSAHNRVLLEGEPLRRAQAGYYGLIEQLDEEVVPLIDAFKARSEKAGRPWVILFTSDHGELMGDNGYFRKCEPYEGSANIPFIVAGSKELGFKRGVRPDRVVALEDIMPTLLALAGVTPPPAVNGVNLLPSLRDKSKPTRDILHLEHSPCYSAQQAFHALTDGRYKYIWRPADGTEQLFDLKKDPREVRDLARVPGAQERLVEWRGRMMVALSGRPEGFTDGKTLIPGRPYPAIMKGRQ